MKAKKSSRKRENFRRVDERNDEKRGDRTAAVLCILYLLFLLAAFSWMMFDIWIGNYFVARRLGYDLAPLNNASFRLVAFTVMAGGFGGIVNGLRSTLNYYNGFNYRYAWKYVSAPWMGATLALFVYALLRSSVVVFGGSVTTGNISTAQILSNFAAGALAGYGSKDVFIWLDANVHKIFQVTERVPDVTGKPKEVAVSRLQAANLEVGEVSTVPSKNGKQIGAVVDQSPRPQAPIDRGGPVDISVAASSNAR